VVTDDDLLKAIDAIRAGKAPKGALALPAAALQKKAEDVRSVTLSPRQRPRVPQLGLPKVYPSDVANFGGSSSSFAATAPASARKRSSSPRKWIPQTSLSALHRTDTIACSSTGRRCVGAPSKHIKIYVEIPSIHTLMHLWVDPDFPIQPPGEEEKPFTGEKVTACLAPAKTLSGLNSAMNSLSKFSSLQEEDAWSPECLQHVIQKYTGLQPWEQALRIGNTTRLFRRPGATLRTCDIFHGSTIQLGVLSGAERDVALVLRGLRRELQEAFPTYEFDVDVLSKLREPLVKSHLGYEKAMDKIRYQESAAILESVKNLDSEHIYEGYLQKLSAIPHGVRGDEILHPQSDVLTLMDAAEEAQEILRGIFAARSAWHAVENHPDFQEATVSTFADYILDPGVKSQRRVYEKVMTKYIKQYGSAAYARCHDIARFSMQFHTCSRLLMGLKKLKRHFEVVKVENRFAEPTALGWRDITILLKVPLESQPGSYHIAELQLTHRVLAKSRGTLHRHWKTLRSMLPDVCKVSQEDMHRVQCLILSRLQSKSKWPGDAYMIQWALKNSASSSAWISPRWQHQERPHLLELYQVVAGQCTLD